MGVNKMSNYRFSLERFKCLIRFDDEVDFSKSSRNDSNFTNKSLSRVSSFEDQYKILEERYDFAYDMLIKKCLNEDITSAKKYQKLDGKYLLKEPTATIGDTYNELLRLYSNRSSVIDNKNLEYLLKYQEPTSEEEIKKVRKFIKSGKLDMLISLVKKQQHSWLLFEKSDLWFVLKDPLSQKNVRIHIDILGKHPKPIPMKKIIITLKQILKRWNKPFKPGDFREGTLVDCGWHAHLNIIDRQAASGHILPKGLMLQARPGHRDNP